MVHAVSSVMSFFVVPQQLGEAENRCYSLQNLEGRFF